MRKPRAIQLSIPKPCSESWSGMTPAGDGRHCAACDKVVMDFSGMTDRELFSFFKDGRSGCGRFYEGQLERVIAAPREPKNGFWMRAAFGIMVLLGIAKEGKAQKKDSVEILAPDGSIIKQKVTEIAIDTAGAEITGIITDHKRKPISSVSVILSDSAGNHIAITASDFNGEYLIKIPDSYVGESVSVTMASMGNKQTITDIRVVSGKSIVVSHQFAKNNPTFTVGIICRIEPPMLQPKGVHTVHRMKDGE